MVRNSSTWENVGITAIKLAEFLHYFLFFIEEDEDDVRSQEVLLDVDKILQVIRPSAQEQPE